MGVRGEYGVLIKSLNAKIIQTIQAPKKSVEVIPLYDMAKVKENKLTSNRLKITASFKSCISFMNHNRNPIILPKP